MKNAYNTIIECRKQLPSIELRLERVMSDIGPQDNNVDHSYFIESQSQPQQHVR